MNNRKRQLQQLMGMDPKTLKRVERDVHKAPKNAGRIIGKALADFSGIPADLYAGFEQRISKMNAGKAPGIAPNSQVLLFQGKGATCYIYRRKNVEELVLVIYRACRPYLSKRLGRWGSEIDYRTGVKRGLWKMVDEAPRHYAEFIAEIK